jgi:lytic murein transglycosylase
MNRKAVSRFAMLAPVVAAAALSGASFSAHAQLDTQACLDRLRPAASANGLTPADFDRFTRGSQLLESTVTAARNQPEYRETWWEYIAKTVDDERVEEGRRILAEYRPELERIGARFHVDPEALVAIFGIETNYGKQLGKTRVVDAWLTRACTETNPLWAKNAYASVRLLRDGVVQPETFTGSWSGAFGMTQFIPTSFYELAADGDDDGRIDLYGSLPDAFASSANHLRKRGAQWTHGMPALIEVQLPQALAAGLPASPDGEHFGRDDRRALEQWRDQGVRRVDGKPLASRPGQSATAFLFAPTGANGPVFLATANFDAILHYNQSHRYAMAVSLLINRLAGGPGMVTAWPTDDPGLSRAQVRELQQLLLARGHDIGVADGIPGGKTRAAVAAEQARLGMRQTGSMGLKTLEALRRDSSQASPPSVPLPG